MLDTITDTNLQLMPHLVENAPKQPESIHLRVGQHIHKTLFETLPGIVNEPYSSINHLIDSVKPFEGAEWDQIPLPTRKLMAQDVNNLLSKSQHFFIDQRTHLQNEFGGEFVAMVLPNFFAGGNDVQIFDALAVFAPPDDAKDIQYYFDIWEKAKKNGKNNVQDSNTMLLKLLSNHLDKIKITIMELKTSYGSNPNLRPRRKHVRQLGKYHNWVVGSLLENCPDDMINFVLPSVEGVLVNSEITSPRSNHTSINPETGKPVKYYIM